MATQNKIKNLFTRKGRNSNVVVVKRQKKKAKVRKNIQINLNFLKKLEFAKGRYVPIFLIICITIMLIVLGLVYGPFFKIDFIEITRKDNITNMDIAYKSLDLLRGEKLFDVKEQDVFDRLKNYQDNIKSVSLNLSLPDTLEIEIESYKEIYNVLINGGTYILLENGTLIPGANIDKLRVLNIKREIDRNSFIEYRQVFNPYYLDRISSLTKRIEDGFTNVEIKEINYYETEREVHYILENSGILIFSIDSENEINEQIEKLIVVNKDYFGLETLVYRYIDLRIRNKVFYCHIDNRAQCEANLRELYPETSVQGGA